MKFFNLDSKIILVKFLSYHYELAAKSYFGAKPSKTSKHSKS